MSPRASPSTSKPECFIRRFFFSNMVNSVVFCIIRRSAMYSIFVVISIFFFTNFCCCRVFEMRKKIEEQK
jgi:hypothetical protein